MTQRDDLWQRNHRKEKKNHKFDSQISLFTIHFAFSSNLTFLCFFAFDVKLEGFDAAAKIRVIKEVRTFTDLGLKEAKDLLEKSPTLLKKDVTKEEAEKIIARMKEVGAKVSME